MTEIKTTDCSLCVSGVHFDIGPQRATLHCHCEIPHGRLIGVLGPNGCGKSSLFRALVGEIPYYGEISYFGKSFAQVKHQVGYLPQHLDIPSDFPITVQEFIAAGSPCFQFKWPGRDGLTRNGADIHEPDGYNAPATLANCHPVRRRTTPGLPDPIAPARQPTAFSG